MKLIYIDLFCGAGGTSTGVEQSRIDGRSVATVGVCVNHDANAIASHAANHPHSKHYTEDIRTLDLTGIIAYIAELRVKLPNAMIVLWASLECTNFSIAKGGQSRDADSRTLAEHLFRYIEAIDPDYIQIENVKEFMTWGPLINKVVTDKKTGYKYSPLTRKTEGKGKNKRVSLTPTMVPDPAHKGEYYKRWVDNVCAYGYAFDYRILNAADFGARTCRKRFFGQFAKDGLPISWPEQTHNKNGNNGLYKWLPVKDVLDLNDTGASIFDRKKPLVDATLDRIHAGLVKFVAGGKDAFMVKYNSMSESGTYKAPGVDEPCPTVACQNRLGVAQVVFMSKYFSGSPESKNFAIDTPAHTITAIDHHSVVAAQFLSAYYGNGHNHSVDGPAPVLTTKDRLSYVQPCFMDMAYGNGTPMGVERPAATITTNPKHQLVVCKPWIMNTNFRNTGSNIDSPAPVVTANRKWHYLMNPQYSSAGGSVERPCFTLIARMDKMPPYLMSTSTNGSNLPSFIELQDGRLIYKIYSDDSPAMVQIKEFMALYAITDIMMRMLKILEMQLIMGFPIDYTLIGSQEEKKKYIGNAVEVTMARVICEATARKLIEMKIAA